MGHEWSFFRKRKLIEEFDKYLIGAFFQSIKESLLQERAVGRSEQQQRATARANGRGVLSGLPADG